MNTNLLLIIVLSLLTINFVLVSVFVVLILKELRKIGQKANLVLEDIHAVTNTVSKPVGTLVGIISSVAEGVKAVNSIRNIKENSDRRKEDE